MKAMYNTCATLSLSLRNHDMHRGNQLARALALQRQYIIPQAGTILPISLEGIQHQQLLAQHLGHMGLVEIDVGGQRLGHNWDRVEDRRR